LGRYCENGELGGCSDSEVESRKETEMASCKCPECQQMCAYRTCWPTPEEADKLLDLGYANQMWLDYWIREDIIEDLSDYEYDCSIYIIAPAGKGYGGRYAPSNPAGKPCVLQDENGLCTIHDICKPMEGRLATCKTNEIVPNLHEKVAMLWDSDLGRKVVKKWERLTERKD
jgi:hypothetical protein